ncbi:2-keto-3-deoxygluconate kinase [Dictyobacter alpinus]|uniref:2-keto-3-deoxygluconate kinase n=1 Tax=Dictyobacter alpinus TaxID=2014873 RepID=A0A402B6A8_9CHLR|nr:sugar kinase [Dictyobacter alpinus]GCE26886.1 2-keto-3-deoxygluconate kinase [Dictyobacter alpinus]
MPVDVISFGETMFRLTTPVGNRLESTPSLDIHVGGSESNTLASLARLNYRVSWLSCLPDNPLGRHVERVLRSHGIDVSQIVWAAPTARLGTFYVEEAPRPIGLQVYYDRANSACALIDPDAVNYQLVDNARLLHLTGITPALSTQARTVFQRLLDRARAQQVPLSFDVNYRAKLWSASEAATQLEAACQQASILFCSYADATEIWNFQGDPQTVLHQMANRFGSDKALVLTLGSEGSAHLDHGKYTHVSVFDTGGHARFGSGDAFDAGYLYAHLKGPLYQELAEQQTGPHLTPLTFGNALAAFKRCIPGDIAIIRPEDVKTLLQRETNKRFR